MNDEDLKRAYADFWSAKASTQVCDLGRWAETWGEILLRERDRLDVLLRCVESWYNLAPREDGELDCSAISWILYERESPEAWRLDYILELTGQKGVGR